MTPRRRDLAWWGRVVARAPVVHFLALGALLLVLEAAFERPEPLRVSEARVRLLAEEQYRLRGRAASPDELAAAVGSWVADELAVREARRLGLHRDDLVIHRRLLEKMEILSGDSPGRPAHLLEQALELGLDRSDPIVRRRLIQRLEHHWVGREGVLRVSSAELESFLESHADRYRLPSRVELSHVFVAESGEGGDGERRARTLLAELRDGVIPTAEAAQAGDAFPLGFHWRGRDSGRLARTLGTEAAAPAFEAPVGEWVGPVASAWGHHLLFVHRRSEPELPTVETLRPQLLQAMADEREQRVLANERQALRRRSRVVVDMPEPAVGRSQASMSDTPGVER